MLSMEARMLPHLETALRHVPKQQRSQRRVDQILHSAEAVFAEVGYDHATTNAVAVRAGISIGSLYQFFESKEAILEAMGQRYLQITQDAMVRMIDQPDVTDTRDLLKSLLETMVKLQEQRPYFLQCLGSRNAYEALTRSVNQVDATVTAHVRLLLERISTISDPKELDRKAVVCVRLFSSLLPLALTTKGKERQIMIQEMVAVIERYLAPVMVGGSV